MNNEFFAPDVDRIDAGSHVRITRFDIVMLVACSAVFAVGFYAFYWVAYICYKLVVS